MARLYNSVYVICNALHEGGHQKCALTVCLLCHPPTFQTSLKTRMSTNKSNVCHLISIDIQNISPQHQGLVADIGN